VIRLVIQNQAHGARALQGNIVLMSSSWLHLLKVRSLRQTRGGSWALRAIFGACMSGQQRA